MRLGAVDFITKPFRFHEIQMAIERTRKYIDTVRNLKTMQHRYHYAAEELQNHLGHTIIGDSPAMAKAMSLMSTVAQTDETTVLITGESGTGKELVARGIHSISDRKHHPFCSVNVSAIPVSLFESEFFGHKKGAFTDAGTEKAGWFEIADSGTLFLDEISEMSMDHQAKLLRILEERVVIRVGTHQEIPVNVRIISATNQDIGKMVEKKQFREDLYYRLNTFIIDLPPLRHRKEDLTGLLFSFMQYFSQKMKKTIRHIVPDFYNELMSYDFPGNVRELKNIMERAVILCNGDTLRPEHLALPHKQNLQTGQEVSALMDENTGLVEVLEKN